MPDLQRETMKTTAAANRWLNTFTRWYSGKALLPVAGRARQIAKSRGARRLGKGHLQQALKELAGVEQ
jgi:hypothetical protein